MSRRIPLLALFSAALAASACQSDDPTSPTGAGSIEAAPEQAAEEVARVEVAPGHTITFIDLGEGDIGIAEMAPEQHAFVSPAMIEQQQATALEVYMALRPAGAAAPEQLVRDHERGAMARSTGSVPRLLANPTAGGRSPFTNPGHGSYVCDHFGSDWVADWKAAFVGITKYREATYLHNYSAKYTFYPGAPVYHGTNTNSKTYLGACNGDDEHDLRLEIHRWINGKWTWILTAGLAGGSKYTFYSGIPARYRARTYGADDETVEHYGVGAAWTLSPGRVSP